jgi:hypothetical protein
MRTGNWRRALTYATNNTVAVVCDVDNGKQQLGASADRESGQGYGDEVVASAFIALGRGSGQDAGTPRRHRWQDEAQALTITINGCLMAASTRQKKRSRFRVGTGVCSSMHGVRDRSMARHGSMQTGADGWNPKQRRRR